MTHTIAFHSMFGGTGCTTLSVAFAQELARAGHKVGIVDTSFAAPQLHKSCEAELDETVLTLNDVMRGEAVLGEALISTAFGGGEVMYLCADGSFAALARNLRDVEQPSTLGKVLDQFAQEMALDYLIIDTATGVVRESLIALAAADTVFSLLSSVDEDGVAFIAELVARVGKATVCPVINRGEVDVWNSAEFITIPEYRDAAIAIPQQMVNAVLGQREPATYAMA